MTFIHSTQHSLGTHSHTYSDIRQIYHLVGYSNISFSWILKYRTQVSQDLTANVLQLVGIGNRIEVTGRLMLFSGR